MGESVTNKVAQRVSAWNRGRKWKLFLNVIADVPDPAILDVGFSPTEYSPVDNYLQKHYDRLDRITALTIEDPSETQGTYVGIHLVQYPGGAFPFGDREFDVVWSNAVLEHVGGFQDQVAFLREIDRVGKAHFVTTPNRWFPIELHTRVPLLHYLPKSLFDQFLHRIDRDWAAGDFMHLLSGRQACKMVEAAGIKNYRIQRNRLCGFTMDFAITW